MNSSPKIIRLCFGYTLAPLATPLTFLLFGWLYGGVEIVRQMGALVIFSTPTAYLIAFLFGTAMVLFLGTRGKTSWRMFALGGFFVGAIPGIIFITSLPICALAGALSSWVFWVCVYWRADV